MRQRQENDKRQSDKIRDMRKRTTGRGKKTRNIEEGG